MIRVWVTRDEPAGGPLSRALGRAGLEPVLEPVLMTTVIGDARREIAALTPNDWLVLTSPRAVRAVAGVAAGPKVAVVSESSGAAARRAGLRVEYVSPTGESAALWDHIARVARGRRVCFPRSSRSVPPEIAGVALAAPVIYEVRNCAFAPDVVGRCDVASFTSPSAVESMVERLGRVPLPAAAIGPTTRHALRGAGAVVVAEPVRPDFDDLACAIAEAGCGGA